MAICRPNMADLPRESHFAMLVHLIEFEIAYVEHSKAVEANADAATCCVA